MWKGIAVEISAWQLSQIRLLLVILDSFTSFIYSSRRMLLLMNCFVSGMHHERQLSTCTLLIVFIIQAWYNVRQNHGWLIIRINLIIRLQTGKIWTNLQLVLFDFDVVILTVKINQNGIKAIYCIFEKYLFLKIKSISLLHTCQMDRHHRCPQCPRPP